MDKVLGKKLKSFMQGYQLVSMVLEKTKSLRDMFKTLSASHCMGLERMIPEILIAVTEGAAVLIMEYGNSYGRESQEIA